MPSWNLIGINNEWIENKVKKHYINPRRLYE